MILKKKLWVIGSAFCVFLLGLILCNNKVYMLFLFNMFMLFLIIYKAQFSIMSVWAFVPNYTLMSVFYYYETGIAYGKLAYIHKLYMNEMCIALICYNIIIFIFCYYSHLLQYEKKVYEADVNINTTTAIIFAILAVVMVYIAFPSLNFTFDSSNRFNALLPGHFWNHFSIILLLFAVGNLKNSRIIQICFCIVIAWFLLHSERVDVLGLLIFLIIRYCSRKNYNFSFKVMSGVTIIGIFIFVVFLYIGNSRAGEQMVLSVSSFWQNFMTQSTSSDLGHVFNGTIDYVNNKGLLYGKTYITYLQGLIPMFDQPLRAGHLVGVYYHTAGGEFIISEPYINFGYIGILVIITVYICIVEKIIKKNTLYGRIVFYFLTASAVRYLWYGLTYIETGIIYLIPLSYLLSKVLKIKIKKKGN